MAHVKSKLEFDEQGYIKPVKITFEGVAPVPLGGKR